MQKDAVDQSNSTRWANKDRTPPSWTSFPLPFLSYMPDAALEDGSGLVFNKVQPDSAWRLMFAIGIFCQ